MVELPIRCENVDQTRGIKLLLFSYSISLRKVFNWMKYRGRSYIIAHYIFRKSNFFFQIQFSFECHKFEKFNCAKKIG